MTNITIQFTPAQVQALAGLLDAGLRATGLKAARDAAELLGIIESAVAAAQTPANGKSAEFSLEGTN
jgi:hypothetical protein